MAPLPLPAVNDNKPIVSRTRVEQCAHLSAADRGALLGAMQRSQRVAAGCDFDGNADSIRFILNGFAARIIAWPDGRCQFTELLMPGDVCDGTAPGATEAGHALRTLTPVIYRQISRPVFARLIAAHPRLADALQDLSALTDGILRERIASLGIRTAKERVAHLLCEVFVRSQAAANAQPLHCDFPLENADLAALLGLNTLQTKRALGSLCLDGRIRLEDQVLTILDFDGLQRAGRFDPRYLSVEPVPGDLYPTDDRSPGRRRQ